LKEIEPRPKSFESAFKPAEVGRKDSEDTFKSMKTYKNAYSPAFACICLHSSTQTASPVT